MSGYASLEVKKNELIRKGLQGSVFIAPATAASIDVTTLFDTVTGDLSALPAGYSDLGWTADTGAVFARKVTSTDIAAWGTLQPVRSDITADTATLAVTAHETKLLTLQLGAAVSSSAIVPGNNGVTEIAIPLAPAAVFYRVLAVAVDTNPTTGGEIVLARYFPHAQVTNFDNQSYANGKDPIEWGVTFTAYQDSTLGYAQAQIYGGSGWLSLLGDMGFTRTVTGSTTSASADIVATVGTFRAGDVGATITGAGIPANATIITYTDATHVTISANATATASGVVFTIGD